MARRLPALRAPLALLIAAALGSCPERGDQPAPMAAAKAPADAGAAPEPAPARPPAASAIVAAVEGTVERQRDGAWAPLKPGDRVVEKDDLRTGARSQADLEIGTDARITVSEATLVGIAELTEAVHRFKLRRGRVSADYRGRGERVLRIESEDGAIAEARAARLSALAAPGSFTVATETGGVDLRAAGGSVSLQPNQQASVSPGRAPTAPHAIPKELLLKVAAAARRGLEPCRLLEGSATPGSTVEVDGRPVETRSDGRFSVEVLSPAKEGVRVTVRDAAGRFREERVRCPARAVAPGAPRKDEDPGAIDGVEVQWK